MTLIITTLIIMDLFFDTHHINILKAKFVIIVLRVTSLCRMSLYRMSLYRMSNVVTQNVVIPNVAMPSVIMPNVAAPSIPFVDCFWWAQSIQSWSTISSGFVRI